MGRSPTWAFTLIETLVVAGVVVLLAALLYPVFARARERGNRTVCQSNLHHISLAMQLYVQDFDGSYPGDAGNGTGWETLILPYVKDPKTFRCPTLGHPTPALASSQRDRGDYDYNRTRLTLVEQGSQKSGTHEARVSDYASSLWVNYCTDANTILADPNYQQGSGETVIGACGRSIYFVAVRHHDGGTNWSFLDGHVKWFTPEQLAEVECRNPPLH